ncbi:hypothetical protein PspLS_05895 [Pyricularia sp. CBS 133598]|nr:hypothetical protein PspLS_05895 [Pyricularia sp. CBS 133598]
MANIMEALRHADVLHILPPQQIEHKLTLYWPGVGAMEPGQVVDYKGVQQRPEIHDDTNMQVCQWFVADCLHVGPYINLMSCEEVNSYVPPLPPVPKEDSGAPSGPPPRYMFFMLKPKPTTDMQNVADMFKMAQGALGLHGPTINTKKFLEGADLEIVAATVLLG